MEVLLWHMLSATLASSAALCADACPLGIITEGEDKYVIDADQCVSCGTCAAECPNEAISEE